VRWLRWILGYVPPWFLEFGRIGDRDRRGGVRRVRAVRAAIALHSVDRFALGVPEAGRLLAAGRGGAVFRSGGPDHYAEVRVELWPLRPSVTVSGWDGVDEAQLETSGTELRLASPTAWVSDRPLLLPAPGGYRVRAAAAGREAAARARFLGSGPLHPSGLERWLIQLWPA
jgi:hypothetical protein